jgi:hypothetical protein
VISRMKQMKSDLILPIAFSYMFSILSKSSPLSFTFIGALAGTFQMLFVTETFSIPFH